ncbi:MAG: hypothetical protein WDZ77_00415 [Candidatus Pacearchaeota archaeon]
MTTNKLKNLANEVRKIIYKSKIGVLNHRISGLEGAMENFEREIHVANFKSNNASEYKNELLIAQSVSGSLIRERENLRTKLQGEDYAD